MARSSQQMMFYSKKIKNIKKPKLLDAEENTTSELITYFSHVVFSYQGLKGFTGLEGIMLVGDRCYGVD